MSTSSAGVRAPFVHGSLLGGCRGGGVHLLSVARRAGAARRRAPSSGHDGHPGHESEERQDSGGHDDRPTAGEELLAERPADLVAGRAAGDDDAGGRGHEQRRELRGERVADGEDRERFRGLGEVHPSHHAEDEAPRQVDAGDEQAGDGVAVDELARAVHRAVEVRLALEALAARPRLVARDGAGRKVGVDRHLLAGHRVEGEARGDLGDAAGALGHDDEVDDGEDQEDHEADEDVALDDEAAERLDDRPGRPLPFAAVEQDQARGGDVEAQPEQRRDEDEGREGAELESFLDEEGSEEHPHRKRDRQPEQQVEQLRRQRQDHHQDDADDARAAPPRPTCAPWYLQLLQRTLRRGYARPVPRAHGRGAGRRTPGRGRRRRSERRESASRRGLRRRGRGRVVGSRGWVCRACGPRRGCAAPRRRAPWRRRPAPGRSAVPERDGDVGGVGHHHVGLLDALQGALLGEGARAGLHPAP